MALWFRVSGVRVLAGLKVQGLTMGGFQGLRISGSRTWMKFD